MLDKIKEFVTNGLGLLFGAGLIAFCVNMFLLIPTIGNQLSQLMLIVPTIFNMFPYPLNWLLFIPFLLSMIVVVIKIFSKGIDTIRKAFGLGVM